MEKNDQLFMQLLYMFHTSAMQGLGKIADPSGQVSRNLEYVSQTIDLMTMLKEKTKGNISEDIEKVLDGMLNIGMVPQINILICVPESTPQDVIDSMMATCEYIEKGCDVAVRGRLEVYPGAPLAENPLYGQAIREWKNSYTGQTLEIVDHFIPFDPKVAYICRNFDTLMDEELQNIKSMFGWEGQNVHKRIIGFSSLIAISKLLDRPDLAEHFLCRLKIIVGKARTLEKKRVSWSASKSLERS